MTTSGVILVVIALFIGFESIKLLKGTTRAATVDSNQTTASGGATPAVVSGSWTTTVVNWAKSNSIDPLFPLALIAQESSGNPNAKDPTSNSWGWLQINLDAHPTVTKACTADIVCSLNYWGANIVNGYNTNGGDTAFHSDPQGFLRRVVPSIQQSIPWTTQEAQAAYATAQNWLRTAP